MKEKILCQIKQLNDILQKYNKLNKDTNYKYDWRVRAIETQIETLESILEGCSLASVWNICYKEDLRESQK